MGVERSANASHRLSARNSAFAILALARFVSTGSLSCLRWYRMRVAIDFAAAARCADLILIEHSQLLPYVLGTGRRFCLDMHNVESALLWSYARSAPSLARRWSARYESWRLARLERRGARAAEAIFVVSEYDARLLAELVGRNMDRKPPVVVARNGTVRANFNVALVERRPIAVFVATLGWRPNIDAAVWLVSAVWPRVVREVPGARLQLIGRQPSDTVRRLGGGSVEVLADVASVAPFISTAAVATAPLLAAGGTRLKIIEALSFGTPVVATRLGALGLEELESDALVMCDEPLVFADALVRHLRNPQGSDRARSAVTGLMWDLTLAEMVETLCHAGQVSLRERVRTLRDDNG